MKLNYRFVPATHQRSQLTLVFVHGFLGNTHDWDTLLPYLSEYDCALIDLPGHGASVAVQTSGFAGLNQQLEATLADILEHSGATQYILIGYSLGGRVALNFACQETLPQELAGLLVEGAHPGLSDLIEREARRLHDAAWAQRLLSEPLADVLDDWYRQPIFADLSETRRGMLIEARLSNDPQALAAMLVATSLAEQQDFAAQLPKLPIPFLYVSGAEDLRFTTLGKTLKVSHHILADVGHNAHIARPQAFAATLINFYNDVQKRRKMIKIDEAALYAPIEWRDCSEAFSDILYHKSADGIAKITINRPQVRNAFRPLTAAEMCRALEDARYDPAIGVVILTGAGDLAFCSGGDQKIRGDSGYRDDSGTHHLNILDFQRQIRSCPKPVIAMVAGYAIGGGHVLHMLCDLSIAADNARFGQTGPRVGSFDGGWGASYMARIVGQKKAREIWFLCRQYDAREALEMGLVNTVVPLADLEKETVRWCREILLNSPLAIRCLKAALNADCDGQAGLQELAGNATMLYYMSEEGQEGRNAFNEKRLPDFKKFTRNP